MFVFGLDRLNTNPLDTASVWTDRIWWMFPWNKM